MLINVNVGTKFYDCSTMFFVLGLRCFFLGGDLDTCYYDGVLLRRPQRGNAAWSEMAMPSRRAT
jgi:hypothetical protein